MNAPTPKPTFAWLVQVEDNYGTKHIRARVVMPQENGELHSPRWGRFEPGGEFADFRVGCYLGWNMDSHIGGDPVPDKLWGLSHDFQPFRVESEYQASAMLKVFRRVERGLQKANGDEGYLHDGDYLRYLLRISAALRIRKYYVRNFPEARNWSGNRFDAVDVPLLQSWIETAQYLAANRPADLVGRDY